ncbi:MAG: FAD-dependent oxidoreductase [bacterium]
MKKFLLPLALIVLVIAVILAVKFFGKDYHPYREQAKVTYNSVRESAREIPLAYQVDVVVVGGTTGAVAAATAAAKAGAKVFLAAPRPFLGEDMTATYRLWLESDEKPESALAKELFSAGSPTTPMKIKRALDDSLLNNGVQFLYNSYYSDILTDKKGNPCGVVIVNRAGRQAVTAKVIIDATENAGVARLAGAKFTNDAAANKQFTRVVMGGKPRTSAGVEPRSLPPIQVAGKSDEVGNFVKNPSQHALTEYRLQLDVPDDSFASRASAEQQARDLTYTSEQEGSAETLFSIPATQITSQKPTTGEWRGAAQLDLGALQPAKVKNLYVLGGCADIPRTQAEKLLRPLALIDIGTRVGIGAADMAKQLPAPVDPMLVGDKGDAKVTGDVSEELTGPRPIDKLPTIHQQERVLPVLGEYDVVVIGGGTSGCPAGIAAARQKMNTLVIEFQGGLGGTGTLGEVNRYWYGKQQGFSKEVPATGNNWNAEQRAEWWRTTLRKAGAKIWLNTMGVGAFTEKGVVKGVVVATPQGRGVVLAKVVIDSTGNADIAAAAGAQCVTTDATDIAWQTTGVPPRDAAPHYTNTDVSITDETDMVDVWNIFLSARRKYERAFDLVPLLGTRERRRIVGDYSLTVLDEMTKRTYPDSIVQSMSNCDSHSYTTDPFFELNLLGANHVFTTYTPYRCLLPKGLDGILVTGLGVSAHRDAMPVIRMQRDLQNQGYAAGLAAAQAVQDKVQPRVVNLKAVQQKLVEIGNLPSTVLTDVDSLADSPALAAEVATAVSTLKNDYLGAPLVLAKPNYSIKLLQQAYLNTSDPFEQQRYAELLAIMGDATGLKTLIETVEKSDWKRGMYDDAKAPHRSDLAGVIFALGCLKDKSAAPVIVRIMEELPIEKQQQADLDNMAEWIKDYAIRDIRACALALEKIGDPASVPALVAVLQKTGMQGHVMTKAGDYGEADNKTIKVLLSVREITLARVIYRLGDTPDKLGKGILEGYRSDLRGHFARHADAILKQGNK